MTINTDFSLKLAALAQAKTQALTKASERKTGAAEKSAAASFAAALDTAKATDESAATSAPAAIHPLVKHEARKVGPLEQFEGFVLRSFVESMLPDKSSGFFGKGTAGEIWRSMLADQIGKEIAASGGIGIADVIAKKEGIHTGTPHHRAEGVRGVDALNGERNTEAGLATGSDKNRL
ncbi:rod-binding protein [Jiella sp. MQZ9-1]|uniref:Rod-binding protein n=1 Tax=Jiella flava TaxID=2816857 RepID=A0A939JQU2_9HYPH|nr:rod-binding protein [Jiella flava]MBO0661233.1 rod-binding protein [Jiella flava]MCD2469878.1 rod-binding protein [Jiella flava]